MQCKHALPGGGGGGWQKFDGGTAGGTFLLCPGISIIHLSRVFFGLLMNNIIGIYLHGESQS